jgi:hypothetical protein
VCCFLLLLDFLLPLVFKYTIQAHEQSLLHVYYVHLIFFSPINNSSSILILLLSMYPLAKSLLPLLQAASPTDDESTMTFHDALSDEEDVLIADLELDEEEDRGHRNSDIVDLDSVSLS